MVADRIEKRKEKSDPNPNPYRFKRTLEPTKSVGHKRFLISKVEPQKVPARIARDVHTNRVEESQNLIVSTQEHMRDSMA